MSGMTNTGRCTHASFNLASMGTESNADVAVLASNQSTYSGSPVGLYFGCYPMLMPANVHTTSVAHGSQMTARMGMIQSHHHSQCRHIPFVGQAR